MKLTVPEEIKDAKTMYTVTKELGQEVAKYFKTQMGKSAQKKAGFLLNDPHSMAMELLEKIVCVLPKTHIDVQFNVGHSRLFSSGTYEIKQPIPQAMYLEALKKAHIIV